MKKSALILGLILLTAACTQEEAPVVNRGSEFYGHGAGQSNAGSSSDNENYTSGNTSTPGASGDWNTQENDNLPSGYKRGATASAAPAPVVGVSELPPTQGAASAGVSATNSSSPFSAPSKPLAPEENPSQMASQQGTIDTTGSFTPISPQDGISLIWPVNGGKIIGHFKGVMNDGINIAIANGEPIMAAASGTVVYSGSDLRDYGNMVILRHDNGWMTAYANASKIVAKKGTYVKQGDIIAYVGTSGNVKSPQLHFALRKGKTPVDPEKYLPKHF